MPAHRHAPHGAASLTQTRKLSNIPPAAPESGVRACDERGYASAGRLAIPQDEHVAAAWFKLDAIVGDKHVFLKTELAHAPAANAQLVDLFSRAFDPVRDALAVLHADVLDGFIDDGAATMLWYSCIRSVYDWALRVLEHCMEILRVKTDEEIDLLTARDEALRESSSFIPPLVHAEVVRWAPEAPGLPLQHLHDLYARIVTLNNHWSTGESQ